ncbi:MAG: FtsQ-type POTRA domain-containing protein [Spirochaetales bacterium]|nr:FtsQ-type POTRA domain-containing protein [Spirochaetales bacterium]
MILRRMPSRNLAAIVVILASGVLLVQILWYTVASPRLALRTIILDSDLDLADSQLIGMLGIESATWTSIDEEVIESRLESYPVIRKAKAVKVFPDSLRLFLYRRKPVATVLAAGNSHPIPVVFDGEGYAVSLGAKGGDFAFPVISGASFSEPTLGDRLPENLRPITRSLARLRDDDPQLYSMISELEILPRGREGYEIKMYMNHVPIPILVDNDLGADSLRSALLVLDVLSDDRIGPVGEADLRGGHVVFHRKEESS